MNLIYIQPRNNPEYYYYQVLTDINSNFSALTASISGSTGGGFSGWTGSSGLNSIIQNDPLNSATGIFSIAAGFGNNVNSDFSNINGGYYNAIASGKTSSAIGGGYGNSIYERYDFIGGGYNNVVSGANSSVVGGRQNQANGDYSSVVGGYSNIASGKYSSVLGGKRNVASGTRSTILGGYGITGTTDDTVYVPYLNVKNIFSATPIINLGLDAQGNVVTGTTGGGGTYVQPGNNIATGGTESNPIISVVDSPSFNSVTASGASSFTTLSATTFISGSTDLYDIIHSDVTGATSSLTSVAVQNGLNTYTGGTASLPTINVSALTINSINISGAGIYNTLSGDSITATTSVTTPIIIGGTATTSNIIFKSTIASGTTTGIAHQFIGGNNGDVTGMTILNNGNVGIGTATPSQLFSVGSANNFTISSTGGFIAGDNSAISGFLNMSNVGDIRWLYAGTLSNPALSFNGNTSTGLGFYSPATDSLGFITSGSERVRISSTGNVGIGTTSPSYKFDVEGTVAADGIRSGMGFDIYPVPNPSGITGVASAGTGLSAGTYYYRISYYTALGETNSILSSAIVTSGGNLQVTLAIPVSTDPRVIGRKIYRTKVDVSSTEDRTLTSITENTSVSYIDSVPDSSLGATAEISLLRANTTSKQITVGGNAAMMIDINQTTFGYRAGESLTTGGWNAFFGTYAGEYNDAGYSNSYFGYQAGRLTTNGGDNVAIGSSSLYDNLGGTFVTAVGAYALSHSLGHGNTALGRIAGYSLITGTYNTFVGYGAGYNPFQKTDATNSMALGNNSYTTKDNQIVIGTTATTETLLFGTTFLSGGFSATSISATTLYSGSTDLYNMFSPTGASVSSFGLSLDGGGGVITTGQKGYMSIPYNGTIQGWTMIADQSGTCVIDIWKLNGDIPTAANTISSASTPTMTSQQYSANTTVSGWITSVVANDVIGFNVNSLTGITKLNVSVKILKI